MTFDEAFLKKYIDKDIFQDFPFLLTETIQPKIVTDNFYQSVENTYLQVHQEYIHNSSSIYKVIGHLLAVLLYKIKEYFWQDYNPIFEGNRSSQIVKTFKQLLEKNYRDWSVGKAEIAFRVPDYLAKQLKQEQLKKVWHRIMNTVIDKEKLKIRLALLANTEKDIVITYDEFSIGHRIYICKMSNAWGYADYINVCQLKKKIE